MGKILIIADRKGSEVATPRGLAMADKLGLTTEVVAFVHVSLKQLKVSAAEQAKIRKAMLAEREALLQAVIDEHRAPEQKVKLKVVWEQDVATWVNKRCVASAYDAVVKTGRRTETLVHTSTDWQLLRECPAPVLIVSAKKWSRTKPVMACLDLADDASSNRALNRLVLEKAKDLSERLGTELEIICAIDVPRVLADMDLINPAAYIKQAKEDMAPYIKALAKTYGIPAKSFKVKRGPVDKVIVSQAAEKRAQLVVMGTVGRAGIKARLMGNTAEQVLHHLHTDVLALKP